MSDDFEAAVAAVPTLTKDPGNRVKLELYALYKQATVGEVTGKRPGMLDVIGKAKYDAWTALAGWSTERARSGYVRRVSELRAAE
jgi:acyl-CoA-binding protein